jgi:hypothetical protein
MGPLALLPALIFTACGSDDDSSATGGSGGTAGSGASGGTGGSTDAGSDKGVGRVPPPPPSGPVTAGGNTTSVALSKLYWGDTTRDGVADTNAWKDFGYNLDGLISTSNSTEHCTPPPGGIPNAPKIDGTDGIDNAFGAALIPFLKEIAPTATTDINAAVAHGDFTLIVSADLGPETETTATGILSKLHAGAKFDSLVDCVATPTDPNCSPPKFDGTDVWPLSPAGDTGTPVTQDFPQSYITDGTWVSGSRGNIDLAVTISTITFTIQITQALLVMKVTGRGTSATVTEGTIAGLVDTQTLLDELRNVAGRVDPSFCEGPTFDELGAQIRGASDIMNDGTNGDPSKTCNALSIGVGFDAHGITLGDLGPVVPPPADLCTSP